MDEGGTILGVTVGNESITWDGLVYDYKLCDTFPKEGYFRRENEQIVLPHAIGCEAPKATSEYINILKE